MANLKMNIGKGKFWVTALLFFTLASAGPQKAQAGAVTEQLRGDVDRIIDILNDGTLKKKERDEKSILERAMEDTRRCLSENRAALEALAGCLMEKETLREEDILPLIG